MMYPFARVACRTGVLVCLWTILFTAQRPLLAGDGEVSPFDGKTLDGWTTLAGEPVTGGWEVVDGMIHLRKQEGRTGHIITAAQFGDFSLTFEWKIAPGGNSGLKYRVRKYGGKTLGCEYQLLDDAGYARRLTARKRSGALYDLYEPAADNLLKPIGEFNSSRIVVQGDRIEHWLNGTLIVSATVGDCVWQRRIAESKFSDVDGFGENRVGRLMLTDHGSEVWYRVIKFELLGGAGAAGESPAAGTTQGRRSSD